MSAEMRLTILSDLLNMMPVWAVSNFKPNIVITKEIIE